MSKITEYLQATGTFFLATVDGDQPRLRPLGAYAEVDGLTYFGVGDYKDVYKQMEVNPNVEIAAWDGEHFLRYYGTADLSKNEEISNFKFATTYENICNREKKNNQ